MKRLIIGIAILIALLVVGFAAAIMTLNSIDWSEYQEPVAKAAKDATGRELHFSGALNVNISLSPGISADNVTLQNASWASRDEMLTLEHVEVHLKLMPLIFGRIEVSRLEIIGLDLLLETDQQGEGNWVFEAADAAAPDDVKQDLADEDEALLTTAVLKKAVIRDAAIVYSDGVTGETQRFNIDELSAQMDAANAPLVIDLKASYGAEPVELAGAFAGIGGLLSGESLGLDLAVSALGAQVEIEGDIDKPLEADGITIAVKASGDSLSRLTEFSGTPVAGLGEYSIAVVAVGNAESMALSDLVVRLEAAGATVDVTGSVQDVVSLQGIDVGLSVNGDSLAALSTLADSEIPDLGAYSVTANVAGTAEQFNVTNLSVGLADMQIDGDLKADISMEPMRLEVVLRSPRIDLTRLLPADDAADLPPADVTPGQPDDQNERLFPDDPLPLDALDALDLIDAVVNLEIGTLIVDPETTITNLDIRLYAAAKTVSINPLRLTVMDATVDGRVGLDVVQDAAAVTAALTIRHPQIGDLVEDTGGTMLAGGPFDLDLDVTGSGASIRDIMASLNGSLAAELGTAQVSSPLMQRAYADITAILTKQAPKYSTTEPIELHCVVTNFGIRNGIAEADSFVVDARNIALFGNGHIDLRDESLHLNFDWLADRVKTQNVLPPFKVRGTLASPSGRFDTKALLGNALGLGAGSVTESESGRSNLTAESGPERCRQRLVVYEQIREERARPKEITVESVLKDIETSKDALKKLGGFFKKRKKDD